MNHRQAGRYTFPILGFCLGLAFWALKGVFG